MEDCSSAYLIGCFGCSKGERDLLFFTFHSTLHFNSSLFEESVRLLGHNPFDQSREQLIKLDGGNHRPGNNHFALSFAINRDRKLALRAPQ